MKKNIVFCLLLSLGLCLQAQLPTCVADSSYQRARTFRIARQYEQAFEAYKIAAEEYKLAENWNCYFNCRKHIARIQRMHFNQTSQVYAQLKADLAFAFEKLGRYHIESAELYEEIANTEQDLGLTELELKNRIQALEIRKQVFGANSERVATSYLNIAITLLNENRLREAHSYAEAGVGSLETQAVKNHHFLGNGYNILGLLTRDLKRYQESIFWFKKALEARKAQQARPEFIALAIQNLGMSYEYLGDMEQALKILNEAKTYLEENLPNDLLRQRRTDFYIGKVYKRANQFKKAISYYQKVLPVYKSVYGSSSLQLAIIYNAIGESYFLLDSFPTAYSYYREARRSLLPEQEDFPQLALADEIASTHRLACQAIMENEAWSLLEWAKRDTFSPQRLQQAIQLFDFSLRLTQLGILNNRERKDKELGSFRSHRLYEGAIEAAWRLFQASGDKVYLEQAFAYSERSKASLLREALKASAARNFAGIPDSVLYLEQQLQVLQGQWEQRIAQSKDSISLKKYKDRLFQVRLQKDSLQRQIESQYPAYYQLRYAESASNISVIQQKLKKGEWLISYFTAEKYVYGFGLNQDSIWAFQQDFGKQVRDSLTLFYQLLSDGIRVEKQANLPVEKQQLGSHAYYFFHHILEPIWNQIEAKPQSLLIVPDGILSHFPFELLLVDNISPDLEYSSWPFLLKEIQIRYLPSADWLLTPPKASKATNSFAGFAPVYTHGEVDSKATYAPFSNQKSFTSLAENRTEVSRIHELMGGQRFLDEAASEQAFWNYASNSRLLHLAMHSDLDAENPLFSALVFSQPNLDSPDTHNDGLLHAYELYQMNLDADLIVLSACESGYGKLLQGEGVMSLARSFQYAGGRNIVMSLWQVDDQSTSDLMMEFYQNLDAGMPKAEALRKAKLALLETSPFKHPYYWAGFILSGDDLPIRQPGSLYLRWALMVILFIFIILFLRKNLP